MLSVYAIEESEIYGHGKRAVIWFSGCTLRCPGCVNHHLWDKSNGQKETVGSIIDKIMKYNGISGVTLIGGEPLDQDMELLDLIKAIKKGMLDVVLFTGYEREELQGWQGKVFDLADVVICGRYIEGLRDTTLLLRGSSNQQIIVRNEELKGFYSQEARQVEIIISDTETVYLGFPEDFIA